MFHHIQISVRSTRLYSKVSPNSVHISLLVRQPLFTGMQS